MTDPDQRATTRVRRSPRIFNFIIAGVVFGAIVALALTFSFPANREFSAPQIFGFLFLLTGAVFGVVGAVIALMVDRRSRKRARVVELERETDGEAPGPVGQG